MYDFEMKGLNGQKKSPITFCKRALLIMFPVVIHLYNKVL